MVAGVLMPGAVVVFLAIIPFLDRGTGWRIRDRKMVVIVFTVLVAAAVILTIIGSLFRGPQWLWTWPWQHLYLEL
jgi:quinol-cytochrome oxidoreductase complex cytochrome b subunit